MSTMQQFCLRWNNHQPNFISVFSSLLNSESLVDVTLAAEGRHLQAHKVVLSACSSYFQSLFTINPCQHPIVILKDVKFIDLKIMVDFMYYGEVNVSEAQLPHILKIAEMLKIKGLTETDKTSLTKSQSGSLERTELLTPGDSNWSSDAQRRSLSPSPCPLSPVSRRKRLRKSSTGSGSGSTERTSEDQPNESHMTSPSGSIVSTHIKPEPGFTPECGTIRSSSKQHSSDSEIQRDSSQESVEGETAHQISLQIPQQLELNTSQKLEQNPVDMAGPSTSASSTQPLVTEKVSVQSAVIGSKRGKFLMRQHRIKKENDPSQPSPESDSLSSHFLTVPHMRVERQCSEPMPSVSPPPLNLLTVPGSGILVKQHSHPLLPSQTLPRSSSPISSPLPVHFLTPTTSATGDSDRPVSPVVIVTDPLATSPEIPLKADSAQTATLRVRTEELKRSVSSPQTGSSRSSHCPMVRPGPALGCNFCWNTVDAHGRILRRKTKYHCPECQTNLCIVPCFQEYHERNSGGTPTDPMTLTTSVMRVFPKTSSM